MPAITPHGRLLACTFLLLIAQGTVPASDVQRTVVTALAGTTLVLAFRTARAKARWTRAVTALAVAAVAGTVVEALSGHGGDGLNQLLNAALTALGPPAVAIGVVRELRASDRVRMPAVSGALSLYLLLGMCFGYLYGAMDRLGDGTFFADGAPATGANTLYYSLTTLTTVGYGDFTARTNVGHTISVVEALIGQIYLVTVVALIVSNLGRASPRRD